MPSHLAGPPTSPYLVAPNDVDIQRVAPRRCFLMRPFFFFSRYFQCKMAQLVLPVERWTHNSGLPRVHTNVSTIAIVLAVHAGHPPRIRGEIAHFRDLMTDR